MLEKLMDLSRYWLVEPEHSYPSDFPQLRKEKDELGSLVRNLFSSGLFEKSLLETWLPHWEWVSLNQTWPLTQEFQAKTWWWEMLGKAIEKQKGIRLT